MIMDEYPIEFRKDVLKRFFDYVKSGDSFYVIGAPSVGKTRLMDFLMGDDPDVARLAQGAERDRVKKHYLEDAELASKTWLARVDMNRMRRENDWGFHFYELLLHTVLLACNRCKLTEQIKEIKEELADLDSQVIESKDALKAHRFFEMAVNMLCQSYGIKLCILFDEFDETYRKMPREVFDQLRGIRDANKQHMLYALFLRNLPEKLRDPLENENFYELISSNMLGLGPYSRDDSLRVMRQFEQRREYPLSAETREWLFHYSGGHPGLIRALLDLLKEHPRAIAQMSNPEWFANQETVREEFRKIWAGLLEEEQAGLLEVAHGRQTSMSPSTGKLLVAKGLLKAVDNRAGFFNPLMGPWLSKQ
ncbi:MAG: hypothetical protein HZA15_14635 [Nitrospirae bacterium]|nr:hypothetical protein [Nitrospirota bacterium]